MRLSFAFGLVCSKIDINSRHRRGKSGHLKRAAEVALRAGEALVPRLMVGADAKNSHCHCKDRPKSLFPASRLSDTAEIGIHFILFRIYFC
jgi:hypothetical protein